MAAFATLVFFLASFLLGAFTVLIVGVAVTYHYLSLLSSTKTDTNARSTASKGGQSLSGSGEHPALDGVSNDEKALGGYAKFLTPAQYSLISRDSFPMMLGRSSCVLRNATWQYSIIRGNMLFKYKDKGNNVAQVICLNGCTVEATSTNWSKKDTAIKLSHPEHQLFGDNQHDAYMLFPNGKEFELWFYALQRASALSTNLAKYQQEDAKINSYFSQYHNILMNPDTPNDGAWCNAILARFWWNFQGSKGFNSFLSQGLCQRITKMTDFPGFIESMVLENMSLGTSLPMVSNATLYSITEQGGVIVDMDVVYHTGFEMTINIMTSIQLPGASVKVPASAYMQIKRLSGRMRMQINPPPCDRFWIGFHENPTFDIHAETSIASDSILPNMVQMANSIMKKMDVTNLIVNKLQAHIINETMVLPNMDEWPMPYWPESYDPAEGQDGRPHLIYQRPEKADQPELKKRKSLLKAFSFIDISPDGISVMGTPLVKSTREKEKDKEKVKEKAREKEERKREKQLLRDQEREQEHQLQLVPVEETRALALDKGKEREIDPAERESSREQDLRPTAALHRSMEREAEALRERLREQDRASGVDPRDKYKIKEGGKRWSLTNLRRSHEKHNKGEKQKSKDL